MTPTPRPRFKTPKHLRPPAKVQPPGERFCPACQAKLFLREGENDSDYARRTYCHLKCSRKGQSRTMVTPRREP